MDNEIIKILILEKLIDVLVPKIIGYYSILNKDCHYIWHPNNMYLEEHTRNNNRYRSVEISIHLNEKFIFKNLEYKHTNISTGMRRRENIPNSTLELKSNNKSQAIQEVCKVVDIYYLTYIGMCAINEIRYLENRDNLHIGSIKEILDIDIHIDIINLNTRRLLIEKT